MVIFQQPTKLAALRRNDSPCGLIQFALPTFRFAKSGDRKRA
jgi:hypothetical protein